MEQNGSTTGRHAYSLSGSTLTGSRSGTVRGFMHATKNTATSVASSSNAATRSIATPDGHIQQFQTANGVVRHNWYSPGNGAVGGWVTSAGLGAGAVGTPAVVARPGQSVADVFVRGGDNRVYETWYNWATGAWGGWIGMGGAISSDPQAVSTPDGHVQVFATGGSAVQQNWFAPSNGAVGGWVGF